MDAIGHELATRERVELVFHSQKGADYARVLENWLRLNLNAPFGDCVVAHGVFDDLLNSLSQSPFKYFHDGVWKTGFL